MRQSYLSFEHRVQNVTPLPRRQESLAMPRLQLECFSLDLLFVGVIVGYTLPFGSGATLRADTRSLQSKKFQAQVRCRWALAVFVWPLTGLAFALDDSSMETCASFTPLRRTDARHGRAERHA